ncbi:Phytol kinase 1, chloroplastic [Cymbomonas tetramitiformis]|uniref:phytol kinase n=1 Tax=Cymbomonas tetramitiformis TaxID=36881 RepID=A0AAE0LHJ1_9CHLO|nr:Phytol kinase 1, chloroplastic [Cymbomonas tetramitiformis]
MATATSFRGTNYIVGEPILPRHRNIRTSSPSTAKKRLPGTSNVKVHGVISARAPPHTSLRRKNERSTSLPPCILQGNRKAPKFPSRPRVAACAGNEDLAQAVTVAISSNSLSQDISIAAFVAVAALVWIRLFKKLTKEGVLSQKLSRKLVHITSGTLFVLTWPLFSEAPNARFIAAVVPLFNGIRLVLLGTGVWNDPAAVNSLSREGDPRELLRGPLYYVLIMSTCTAVFWRNSVPGMAALALMCGGDGIADIVGRRYGKVHKLPWNTGKSWAGSIAMFISGVVLLAGFVAYFDALGYISHGVIDSAPGIIAVSLAATLVESLPVNRFFDDNFSVPLVASVVGMLVFST